MTLAPVVHVVDDDASVRTALLRLLGAAGYATRGYASAGEFLTGSWRQAPGCIVLDVCLPGPSGLELQDALGREASPLPIVFLTGRADIPMSVRAMKVGAVDFLTKPVRKEALLGAVKTALTRDADERAQRELLACIQARHEQLTPREKEVLAHVARGKLNKQIASELGTSLRTVKAHRGQVMKKMQVASVAELVRVFDLLVAPPGD